MRIASWNINGVRSLGTSLSDILASSLQCQIVAVQETKVARDALEDSFTQIDGFSSYFSCTRTKRGGYSGVATFVCDGCRPVAAEEGLTDLLTTPSTSTDNVGSYFKAADVGHLSTADLRALDNEGRAVITSHRYRTVDGADGTLVVINVYCPRFDPENEERLEYKLNFHAVLEARVRALREAGFRVLIIGDFNISPEQIDHCDPGSHPAFDSEKHRQWFRQFLLECGFVDLFRHFHPSTEKAFTCWNTKLSARQTNFGTRLDLAVADRESVLDGFYSDCYHLTDVLGSDHCPVVVCAQFEVLPSNRLPSFASSNFAELRGKQTKLLTFFQPISSNRNSAATMKEPKQKVNVRKRSATLKDFFTSASSEEGAKKIAKYTAESKEPVSDVTVTANATQSTKEQWQKLFRGPPPPPLCSGHNQPCVERIVRKAGSNQNRHFWSCSRPEGRKDDKEANCNHFQWR